MKTSSIVVETSRSTTQSDSIVRQTNKTFILPILHHDEQINTSLMTSSILLTRSFCSLVALVPCELYAQYGYAGKIAKMSLEPP